MKIKFVVLLSVIIALISAAIGYEIRDIAAKENADFVLMLGTSTRLASNSAALATLKQNRIGCTKWLLQNQVSSTVKNWSTSQNSPNVSYASKNSLALLDKEISQAKKVLESTDLSGTNANGCVEMGSADVIEMDLKK